MSAVQQERHGPRLARFATTSVVCTVLTQLILWVLVAALDWHGGRANIVAVLLTTIPSYLIAKHWVWGQKGPSRRHGRDMSVFWATSLAGLTLSTVLASVVYRFAPYAWAVSLANLTGFGLLWYARYAIFHSYLFADNDVAEPMDEVAAS